MKKVLSPLKNLPLKKSIAQQLGMNDLLQSLSTTYNEGFLNDIARLWLIIIIIHKLNLAGLNLQVC